VQGSADVELEKFESLFAEADSSQFRSLDDDSEELIEALDLRSSSTSWLFTQQSSELLDLLNTTPILVVTRALCKKGSDLLDRSTALSREFTESKSQGIAGVINSNLLRKLYTLDWKFSLTYSKYKEKRLQVESLSRRVRGLEVMLNTQSQNYASITRLTEHIKSFLAGNTSETHAKKMPMISKIVTRRNSLINRSLMRQPLASSKADEMSPALQMEPALEDCQYMKLSDFEGNSSIRLSLSQQTPYENPFEVLSPENPSEESAGTELHHKISLLPTLQADICDTSSQSQVVVALNPTSQPIRSSLTDRLKDVIATSSHHGEDFSFDDSDHGGSYGDHTQNLQKYVSRLTERESLQLTLNAKQTYLRQLASEFRPKRLYVKSSELERIEELVDYESDRQRGETQENLVTETLGREESELEVTPNITEESVSQDCSLL
jgi:hypothetical protein